MDERKLEETERRSVLNAQRILELRHEINNVASRVHELEDVFEPNGQVTQLIGVLQHLTTLLEQLIDEWPGLGHKRPRHTDQEHSADGTNTHEVNGGTDPTRPRE